MLNLKCKETNIKLDFSGEKLSMLIAGETRMGKTFFMSLLGNMLVARGDIVHLIDIGDKWSAEDKARIALPNKMPQKDVLRIFFPSKSSLLGSAGYIANALGYRSKEVVRMIRSAMERDLREGVLDFSRLVSSFASPKREGGDENEEVLFELNCSEDVPGVELIVDEKASEKMAYSSTVWDLSVYETDYAKLLAQLIIYSLFGAQKVKFHKQEQTEKVFTIMDEFQNLDCDQRSVIGSCLTEGQKYKLYLILATQFLKGKFSEAVISQLKQSGFQIYFRLNPEEAAGVGRLLVYDREQQKELTKILCTLNRGQFVLKGPHYINKSTYATERIRVVNVIQSSQIANRGINVLYPPQISNNGDKRPSVQTANTVNPGNEKSVQKPKIFISNHNEMEEKLEVRKNSHFHGHSADVIPTNADNCRLRSITSERIGNSEQKATIKCVHEYRSRTE